MDTRNTLELEFEQLVLWIREKHPKEQFQKLLTKYKEEDLPEEHKRSFRFFQSIDGTSRELLWRITFNKNCHKKFIRTKLSNRNKTRYK